MIDVEVFEGNREILRFLGWEDSPFPHLPNKMYKDGNEIHIEHAEFHTSWNELMPICKKIIDMYADNRHDIFQGLHHCDIEETFKAVVRFIEFWNDPSAKILTWKDVPFPYDPVPKGCIVHYVREAWTKYQPVAHIKHSDGRAFSEVLDGKFAYKADGFDTVDDLKRHIKLMGEYEAVEVLNDRWHSPATMPKEAARIFFTITGNAVKRVQDVTEEEAVMMGIERDDKGYFMDYVEPRNGYCYPPKASFSSLYESQHGPESYASNPFIWTYPIDIISLTGMPDKIK